jgi:hypothetical protein
VSQFLYVTGILLITTAVGQTIQPLNHTVAFLKKSDVLTSENWRVVVNIELSMYSDIISTLRSDLLIIESQKKEYTPMNELKQIEALLQILESKLYDFYQILPRLDRRRGLINLAGTSLKALFGTATISDIHEIHDVINDLQLKNSDMSHSLSNQLTYVKDLSATVKVNSEAIGNLSDVIKGNIVQSNDLFQQITKDLLQLNITFHGQSALYTTIKQMELSLLQITQQIDDLFDAVQYAMFGKLPVKLISPITLQNILRNVTLTLPEGHELVVGTNVENIHLYYDLVEVAVMADVHRIHLILNVPLKNANRNFTLFEIVAFLSEYCLIDSLNIRLNSNILEYNTINRLTYC